MTRIVFLRASIFALVAAVAPAVAGAQPSKATQASGNTAPLSKSSEDDCESRIQRLDALDAEGEERLAAKYQAIDVCARQYGHDTTIEKLVKECAKFEEQPVLKQQFMADCQLAAFTYANALRALKMEYGK